MSDSAKYVKIVAWSEADRCFVGSCPGIIGPCCHGDDEVKVYRQLCEIVEEWIAIAKRDNKPLPAPTAATKFVEQLLTAHGTVGVGKNLGRV